MNNQEKLSVTIQLAIVSGFVAGCLAIGRDQQVPSVVDQEYSPYSEVSPLSMFGQSVIFYSTHPEYVELGLVAEQVQVIQLQDSDEYKAMQIMEVQNADGDLIYNIMFQTKKGEVEQEWVVLINDTFHKLDIVQRDGKTEFVADINSNVGQLTSTQIIIDTPKEDAHIPISLDNVIGLLSGVKPVLAADEATSTPISTATLTATQEPTFTPIPSDTPFVVDISPTKIKVTVAHVPSTTATHEATLPADPFAGWVQVPYGADGEIWPPVASKTIDPVCFDPKYIYVGINNYTSTPDDVINAIDLHNPPAEFLYRCVYYQGKVAVEVYGP